MALKISVVAGIVTYNPDLTRLEENLRALILQVRDVYIVDNGSDNYRSIMECLDKFPEGNILMYRFEYNMGIAHALIQIMNYAKENDFEWVLTLDQDSVIQSGLLEAYTSVVVDSRYQDAGMLTCLIKDRNFVDRKNEMQTEKIKEVDYCITSAAFTNVEKYFQTKGYDASFFIDCVDFDICYSLRNVGFKIYRVNWIGLYHEVGCGENKRFFWKRIVVYHQNPLRIYYLARNTIWMHKKQELFFGTLITIKKELALGIRILFYEDYKKEKCRSYVKGIRDGIKKN